MRWSDLKLLNIFAITGLFCTTFSSPDNVVTFREADAALVFAPFKGEEAVAIRLEFKTTNADGVLIHGNGGKESNFIQIKIENGNTLQFSYKGGTGQHSLQYSYNRTLTDDTWHTLHLEVNLKQIQLSLDNHTDVAQTETGSDVTYLRNLIVGSAEDYSNGFVGCVGDLMVNSALVDMQGAVLDGRFTYGVHEGCVKTNSCSSSPCSNGGQCKEGYSHFTCDCTATPYGGLLCSKEVGVNLQYGAYIQYSDVRNLLATSFHVYNISFGFMTKRKQGILLQIRNNGTIGRLSIEMNNYGGIKYMVDSDFVRHEVHTLNTGVDYSDGKPHDVLIRRENNGRQIYIQVDNFQPTIAGLDKYLVTESIPDNPEFMYIGNNDTETTFRAFEGCIYRMQIGDFYPLKTAFQDPRPTNVEFVREEIMNESTCGFEEVIPDLEPKELRPYNPNCEHRTLIGLGLGQGGNMSGQYNTSILFTISQSNNTLDSGMVDKLSITCSFNDTEALLFYYFTIRRETSYGSSVFKCIATLEANSTKTSSLNASKASGMGFAASGTLDASAPVRPFLMLEKETESLSSDDVGQYICEAGFKYSTKDALIVSRKLTTFTNDVLVSMVTFTRSDGTLEFATFDGEKLIEIQLAFKTTATEGVLVHLSGASGTDYIQIRLTNGNTIEVLFTDRDGNRVFLLSHREPEGLNNDQWHVVRAKLYGTLAWLRVDSSDKVPNDSHGISVGTKLIIGTVTVGSARDYSSGYVGCMRDLKINGVLVDLRQTAHDGLVTYGVQEGCGKTRKCTSNPCFNGGRCIEGYSDYTCDCSMTPFGGSFCSKEVGVNMQANFMIRFDHVQNLLPWRYFQNISFGLITKKRKGILLQWRNGLNVEYVSTEINNNGGVKYMIDAGFERWELSSSPFVADGRAHEYKMWKENNGNMVFMKTDNLTEGTVYFGTLDGFISNPKYLFIGNNDVTNSSTGFEGCIYRMQIDDFYPLKTAFHDPSPAFVNFVPEGLIREDSCGLEEITHEPEPVELRPFKPKCGNNTEVGRQLDNQAGNSEEEHELTLTFSRNIVTLGSDKNETLKITCNLNKTDVKLIYYLLLRRETASGSNVFECLAIVEAGERKGAVLYENITKDSDYVVMGSVDMSNSSATYLTVEMSVQMLRCDDDRKYMCEVAHRESTISPFMLLRTAKRLEISTEDGTCAGMGKAEKKPDGETEEKTRTGLIVGVTFGVTAAVVIVVVTACYCRARRRKMDEHVVLFNTAT